MRYKIAADSEECEIDYMNKSYFMNSLRNELREIGFFNFLRKHPEYREILSTSKISISNLFAAYRKKFQRDLQKELN